MRSAGFLHSDGETKVSPCRCSAVQAPRGGARSFLFQNAMVLAAPIGGENSNGMNIHSRSRSDPEHRKNKSHFSEQANSLYNYYLECFGCGHQEENKWIRNRRAFGRCGCIDDNERRTIRRCRTYTKHITDQLSRPPGADSGCTECVEDR